MRVIADKKIKAKILMTAVLLSIFAGLTMGTIVVLENETLGVSTDAAVFKTVIIDAGHGGPDGGTSAADGTVEKDLNLQIALKLNELLKAMGVKTVLIRDTDISIHDDAAKTIRQKKISDLKNRLKIINETKDSVFISIHQNHFGESKYRGAQIFYSKNNLNSQILADSIRLPVISYLQTDNTREIKPSGTDIYLLHKANSPAVMVECGFLSNQAETENLKNENYQQRLAFTIAIGIIDYFKKTEGV